MNNKRLLFLQVALPLSFLWVTIEGCSIPGKDGDVINSGTQENAPTQSSVRPVINNTPLHVDQVENPEATPPAMHTFFYVSKEGKNTDGRSLDTAWNELDQIRWQEISPGDTIVLAGGEYQTQMDVEKSGAPGLPIKITTNGQQVVLDGHRPAPPYCGQTNYVEVKGGNAINLEDRSHIVIDGRDWRGIVIKNHVRGIRLRQGASDIIIRNVEIHDNGWSAGSGSNTGPDGPGVDLGGTDILFERVIIHDNGQDAFQAGWGVWNFTLRNSWLYNSREHPIVRGESFNYCSHTDGIQIYDGGSQGPVLIENSIIGPSFTQGIIIGSKATVDDVVIRNTLFVSSDNAGIIISDGGQSSNWTIQNVTVVQNPVDDRSWSIKLNGNGHRIRDSIFWGGPWGIGVFNWSEAVSNFNWLTPDRYDIAVEADPMFVDDYYSSFIGEAFADFDFTVQNPAIPAGIGSSITSVSKLFDQSASTSKKIPEPHLAEVFTHYIHRKAR